MVDILRHRGRGTGVTPGLYHGRDKVMHRNLGAASTPFVIGNDPAVLGTPTLSTFLTVASAYACNKTVGQPGEPLLIPDGGTVTTFGVQTAAFGVGNTNGRFGIWTFSGTLPLALLAQESFVIDRNITGQQKFTLSTPLVLAPSPTLKYMVTLVIGNGGLQVARLDGAGGRLSRMTLTPAVPPSDAPAYVTPWVEAAQPLRNWYIYAEGTTP